jgi:hypothetical protein
VNYNSKPWSENEKLIILAELNNPAISNRKIAKYLGVNRTRIEKLVAKRKLGLKFSDTMGRPRRVDPIGEENISSTILSAKNDGKPLTVSETKIVIENEVVKSDQRRGLSGLTSSVHPQTMKQILRNVKATVEKGQSMTNARHKESKDIRNMVSMAVMNEAYAKFKAPQMIGNYDATQFILSGTCEELLVTIKEDNYNMYKQDVPLSKVEDSKLCQAVKWMMLCNANGNLCNDVFLISDPSMKEDEFNCHQITGLSHNTDPSSTGWLCFCQTRVGNLKFFSWYLSTIVVSFINKCRSLVEGSSKDVVQNNERFYIVADGEDIQIRPLEYDDVATILEENKIDFGKGPASCTNTIGNACDRSNLFKGTKTVLKHITSANKTDFEDIILEDKLYAVMSQFHSGIPSAKARFFSKGMVKIVKSLARVVNFQIIIHGFNRIGVYPLSAEKCLSNCDESVLKQFDAEMIEEIIFKIPGLVEQLLDESNGGQVTEQVMDEVGIPSIERDDRRTTPKDQRTQNQQRAVMLNHPAARKRRKEWLSTKKMREEQKRTKGVIPVVTKLQEQKESERPIVLRK